MFQRKKLIAWLLALGLGACNANPAMHRTPETTDAQGVVSDNRDATPATDAAGQSPATQDEMAEESNIALEPVSIGGAFLTCSYPDNQKQGETSYRMDCQLTPPSPMTVSALSASFRKVDGQGQTYDLTMMQENMSGLSWVLAETPATLFYPTVEATISINGSAKATFRTEITSTMLLDRVATYWLGGEPNNAAGPNGEDEDCAEYENLAGKNNHAGVTGLSTGPLGRFNDTICTLNRNFLCKNIADKTKAKWAVSAGMGPFTASATACPQGYRFALPMGEAEGQEVNALIDQRPEILKLWVPLSDRLKEGEFRISF